MSNSNGPGSSQHGTTNGGKEKDKESLWYFSSEQLANSPSRRQGIDSDQELSYRQLTAYLIQEMGQRLQVSQLCINTAIVYMHRFYAFHSFTHFYRNGIAAASLFLAAKVEEQPRKLEHVIKAANKCLNQPTSSTTDASYIEQAQDLVFNENVLLQTLGFDVAIDHPHTHVVKTCHLVKACKDLAQTSYFLASNSLHLTSMCLQYKPTVVACFCIYLACKWSRWEIPQSTEGKHWFHYVDKSVTMDLLKQLTDEFIGIYEKSPARLKSKLNSIKALAQGASTRVVNKDKKAPAEEWRMVDMMKMYHSSINTNDSNSSSGQSSMYNTPTPPEQQSALLPPPQSQQPTRKSEMHSNPNRPFHNSSVHHHSKMVFPAADVSDHKSSHKLTSFGGNSVNRQREQNYLLSSSSNSSRPASSSANGRSVAAATLVGQSSQRQLTQSHQFDVNFHKSRERGNVQGSLTQAPTSYSNQKLGHKQEGIRNTSKDTNVKIMEQTKQSNSKAFPSSSTANQQFGNHPHLSSSLPIKLESIHEVPRSILSNPRASTSSAQIPYNQTQIAARNASNTIKHDQSKPMSVHIQHQHSKQSAPNEPLHLTGVQDLQTPNYSHTSASYANMRNTDFLHIEENPSQHFNPAQSLLPSIPTQQVSAKSTFSMFSPDWNDKLQNSYAGSNFNGPLINTGNESLGLKMSPKKSERDRMTDIMLKKRHIHSGNESSTNIGARVQPQFKQSIPKKLDQPMNEIAGTSAAVKRPNEGVSYKQEDDLLRDNKLRKLDNSYLDSKCSTDLTKVHIVNGIETNPDLVRSLLKESLCTANALIKSEPLEEPCHLPPADLLAPPAVVSLSRSHNDDIVSDTLSSKNEKKKKKDKHKHKEKDKSKDREERKKHKKEKEKHKDRERQYDNAEPVKIKIFKEKYDSASGSTEPVGLKIKIPKDRITSDVKELADINPADASNRTQAPALKIKISKDKLENYSSGSTDTNAHVPTMQMDSFGSHNIALVAAHNSYKKKERDRKRSNEFTNSNGSTGLAALPLSTTKSQTSTKLKKS